MIYIMIRDHDEIMWAPLAGPTREEMAAILKQEGNPVFILD
jgi:hypothetical protein